VLQLLRFFLFISSFSVLLSCFPLYFFKSCSSLTICPSNPGSILGSKQTWNFQLTPMCSPMSCPR
jgi:hypothetical protein